MAKGFLPLILSSVYDGSLLLYMAYKFPVLFGYR